MGHNQTNTLAYTLTNKHTDNDALKYTHTHTHPQELYLVVCIIGDQNDISCSFEHALEVQGGGPDSPVICIVHRLLGISGMGYEGL
jgi:hypothetical protein